MHRQLNHVWRSRRLVLFADVSRVTAPRRLSTSQRESTRRSAALIYFRLKPPRLLFSPGFVPAYGYNAVEKTEVVQNNGPADDKLGQLFAAERSGEESSPRANLFTYVRCSRGRVTFPRAWHFYPGMCRRCSILSRLNGDLSATGSWQWRMPIQEELETGSRIRPRQVTRLTEQWYGDLQWNSYCATMWIVRWFCDLFFRNSSRSIYVAVEDRTKIYSKRLICKL